MSIHLHRIGRFLGLIPARHSRHTAPQSQPELVLEPTQPINLEDLR